MNPAFGPDAWTRLLIECTLKGSLLLLVAAAATLVLRRSSAAARHLAWTAGMAALLLVAPLSHWSPPWRVALPPALAPVERALRTGGPGTMGERLAEVIPAPRGVVAIPAPQVRQPDRPSAQELVRRAAMPVWLTGAALVFLVFAAGAARLSMLARRSCPVDDDRIAGIAEEAAARFGIARSRFRLRWTERELTPLTWGFHRPILLLPAAAADWSDSRVRQVLIHELAHVVRCDVATQWMSNLACLVYWFNPLVWWSARRMLVERERACDDLVLAAGAAPSTYAHELLEIARSLGAGWAEARTSPAMARRSQISGRLLAVLDPARRRHGVGRPALIAAALVCLLTVLPTAALNIGQAPLPMTGGEPPARPVPEPVKAAIVAVETAWREALKRGDIEAMARLYTRDAILVASTGQIFQGQLGVMEALRLFVAEDVRDVTLEPLEIYPLDGMICEVGRATMWRASGGAAGIRFMSLWKKEQGEWRIHRDFATQ